MTQQQNIIHAHILYNSISILCSSNEIEVNKYYIATVRRGESMGGDLKEVTTVAAHQKDVCDSICNIFSNPV